MTARRLDVAAGVAAALVGGGSAVVDPGGPGPATLLAVLGGGLVGASLGIVRRRPNAALGVALVGMVMAALDGIVADGTMLVLLVVGFCIGRYTGRIAGAVTIVGLIVASLLGNLVDSDSWVPSVMFPLVTWGAGIALRSHDLVAERLRERAAELAEEREAYTSLSVRYERARIAAELHDIVAHAISVMVVQASAGQRLAAVSPEMTTETFRNIAGAARQAEADMGRLVALLSDEEVVPSAPDLALVEELVARAAGSGLDVTLRLEGPLDHVPEPLAAAAYRVVQEGMTNALRYASGAAVQVVLRGEDGALDVEVRNGPAQQSVELRGAGTGNGLNGLRERVDECGGTVEAGTTGDGGWRLRAHLPRPAPVGAGRP